MKALKESLKIDTNLVKFTNSTVENKEFTKVKDQVPTIKNYNFMSDTLYLPEDKKGFKYLLVCVDLADDAFDIEPMKEVNDKSTLDAYKKMLKRKFIKLAEYTMATDSGNEFKGVYHNFIFNNNIYHKVGRAGRHTQQSNVENLNKTISGLFNSYMTTQERKTGKVYREWTDILSKVRIGLNKLRKKTLDNPFTHKYEPFNNINEKSGKIIKPKFSVGEDVYVINQKPKDTFGKNQPTEKFRKGDFYWETEKRTITEVLNFNGPIPYRYIVSGITNASFTPRELKKV